MKVLLTFTGFHDPFTPNPITGEEQEGPILALLRVHPFHRVILISSPRTQEIADETRSAILERFPDATVCIRDLALDDPTDYGAILTGLRPLFREIASEPGEKSYYISTASGTPQMHACWVLLAASGEVPARLLHVRPPRFVGPDRPLVSEVDLGKSSFPSVRYLAPARLDLPSDEGRDPEVVIAQLGIIGDHPSMQRCLETAVLLARSDVPVLIRGESGTGKEKMARLVHQLSDRAAGPFVPVNCAAVPAHLAESVLFGHKKGSFTGATSDAAGKFEIADGGTLFLDETGELPLEIQAKLLRAIQEGVIEPIGRPHGKQMNVRVVAATNLDLRQRIRTGEFREDLYYRICVGEFVLPALRERRSDIPRLALHFLDEINARLRRPRRITPEALAALQRHDWPGNIRELQNVIHRAALINRGQAISPGDLELPSFDEDRSTLRLPEPYEGFHLDKFLSSVRRTLIDRALDLANGRQTDAARLLGISPQAVSKYLKLRGQKLNRR